MAASFGWTVAASLGWPGHPGDVAQVGHLGDGVEEDGLAGCLAAGADLTLMTLCSVLNHEKSRRFPAGRSPGQLQLGLARTCLSKIQTLSEPRNPLAE